MAFYVLKFRDIILISPLEELIDPRCVSVSAVVHKHVSVWRNAEWLFMEKPKPPLVVFGSSIALSAPQGIQSGLASQL
jgi:hypothetical protein